MAAAEFLTWSGNGDDEDPRRPSSDDLGGNEKEDDAEYPPDDVEHFTAGGWNQKVDQIVAIARVTYAAKLEVRYTAGAPAVARVVCPNPDIVAAMFTVTDNGTGDVTVTWPANTFPPEQVSPSGLTILSSLATRTEGHVEEVSNGIRVRLFSNGTAADLDFRLNID